MDTATLCHQLDAATAQGLRLELALRLQRRASLALLEAVDTLKAQWPPGSPEAEIVRGALAGREEAVRLVLGSH